MSIIDKFVVVDAYLRWANATGFRWVPAAADRRFGLMVSWNEGQAGEAAKRYAQWEIDHGPPTGGTPPLLEVARAYFENADAGHVPVSPVWTFTVSEKGLDAFLEAFAPMASHIGLAGAVALSTDGPRARGAGGPSEAPVLLAVLDDGCAFANARFLRDGGEPRVAWLWDQNDASRGAPLIAGNGPAPGCDFGYGGQWSRDDLRDLLQDAQGSEERAYASAGLDGLRRRAAHGTHVLDLLAGPRDGVDTRPWDIVFVQFPKEAIDDPSGIWLEKYAADGLRYVIACAGKATHTIVVNLSWGPQTGPHDGSAPLERLIDQLVDEQMAAGRHLHVCLPAGNSFGSQAHARIRHSTGGTVRWVIPPDGRRPQFLEAWWPRGFPPEEVRLQVTPPGGGAGIDVVNTSPPDGTMWWTFEVKDGSPRVLFVVHPTEEPDRQKRGRHGIWTLAVGASGIAFHPDAVHLYVARATHNMGARRRARASYLTDEPLERMRFARPAHRTVDPPDSAIRRVGTLNGIATGVNSLVIAGYRLPDKRPSSYSSSGPSRGGRVGPDHACLADRSPALPGIRASGVRSGTSVTLVGTSSAAPQAGFLLAKAASDDQALPEEPPASQRQMLPVVPAPPATQPSIAPDLRLGFGPIPPVKGLVHPS